jgi:hypothetical protein
MYVMSKLQELVDELLSVGFSAEEAKSKGLETYQKMLGGQQSAVKRERKDVVTQKVTHIPLGSQEELDAFCQHYGMTLTTRFDTFVAKQGANMGKFGVSVGGGFRGGSKFMLYLSDRVGQTNITEMMDQRDRCRKAKDELSVALQTANEFDELLTKAIMTEFSKNDGQSVKPTIGKKESIHPGA